MIRVADPFKQGSVSQWDGNSEPVTGTGSGTVQMEPGKILRLTQGEDVTFSPGTNRPNGAFMNLVQVMVREMAMGLNMPYGFLYDMSTFGGHASRIEIAQAQRGIRRFQKLLKEQALDPVRNAVLGLGISEGIIPPHPAWKNGHWGFGASLLACSQTIIICQRSLIRFAPTLLRPMPILQAFKKLFASTPKKADTTSTMSYQQLLEMRDSTLPAYGTAEYSVSLRKQGLSERDLIAPLHRLKTIPTHQ